MGNLIESNGRRGMIQSSFLNCYAFLDDGMRSLWDDFLCRLWQDLANRSILYELDIRRKWLASPRDERGLGTEKLDRNGITFVVGEMLSGT